MKPDQIAYMKANRPQLYAMWERMEWQKWDGLWWRFCFTLANYLRLEKRVKEDRYPYSFAQVWWEIGVVARYYPLKPEMELSN